MYERIVPRMGAACGAVFVVLLFGLPLTGSDSTIVLVGELIGLLLFIPFLGYLCSVLREAEGPGGWLAATAFGAGLVNIAIKLGSIAPGNAADRFADGTATHQALDVMNSTAFIATMLPLSVLTAAAAVVIVRTRSAAALARLARRSHRSAAPRERNVPRRGVRASVPAVPALGAPHQRCPHRPTGPCRVRQRTRPALPHRLEPSMKTPPTPMPQRDSRDLERAAVTRTGSAAIAAGGLLALSNLFGDFLLPAERDGDIVHLGLSLVSIFVAYGLGALALPLRPAAAPPVSTGTGSRGQDPSGSVSPPSALPFHVLFAALYAATAAATGDAADSAFFLYALGFPAVDRRRFSWLASR